MTSPRGSVPRRENDISTFRIGSMLSSHTPSSRLLRSLLCAGILVAAVLTPRLATLGTIITNDEPLWLVRSQNFMTGIVTREAHRTFGQVQPGVTTMWIVGLADRFHSLASSQAMIALASSALVLIAIGLLARVCGRRVAFLAGMFLALDPFLIAHSRVIHTDAFLALGMLIALLCFELARRTNASRYFTLGVLASAFATLSKFLGAYLAIPAFLTAFVLQRRGGTGYVRRGLATFFLAIIVVWPAFLSWRTWANEGGRTILSTLVTEKDVGKGGADPLYYPREWFFRLTAVSTLLAPIGVLGLLFQKRKYEQYGRSSVLRLVVTAIGFGIALSLAGQKSDRYFLFGILVSDILAAVGVVWITDLLSRLLPRTVARTTGVLLACAAIVFLGADMARIHPYALAHVNPFFPLSSTQKLGWGEGLEHALRWIAEKEGEKRPPITSYYMQVALRWYGPRLVEGLGHEYDTTAYRYVVLYRSMFGREKEAQESQYLHAYFTRGTCGHEVLINGLPYAWVFERLPESSSPGTADSISSYEQLTPLPNCASRVSLTPPPFWKGLWRFQL